MSRRDIVLLCCLLALIGCGAFGIIQAPRTAGLKKFKAIPLGSTRDEVISVLGDPLAEIRNDEDLKRELPHVENVDAPNEGVLLAFQLPYTQIIVGMYLDDHGRLEKKVEIEYD